MRYQLAIFDLDGTILDTLEDLADSLNHALATAGYPKRTLAEVRAFVGNGLLMLVKRALPADVSEEVAQEVLKELKAYYKVHCADKTKPYDGVLKMLDALKEQGMRLAVVSNKADYAVQILCEQYFGGIFDVTAGEKENVKKKPEPDAVFAVLDELQTAREYAVYIGDSEVDILTAKNAGVDGIFVDWGFRDADYLKECGAENPVSTIEELQRLLLAGGDDNEG